MIHHYSSYGRQRERPISRGIVFAILAILGVLCLLAAIYKAGHRSEVPASIQSTVNFQIYYPSTNKLPAGYSLDTKSFRLAQPGVVLFAVTYGTNKSIVFSEEQQPPSSDIDKFISTDIPVNTTVKLALGQAKLGAYGTAPHIRTIVSLPITKGPWLIATAPADVNSSDIVTILQALTK